MEIYTGFDRGNKCLVLFKTREGCKIFINYITSLRGDVVLEPKSTRSYSNYLGSFAFRGDWTIIYPQYVLKEDVDNFIKLMED
jgi:hypothetical protein